MSYYIRSAMVKDIKEIYRLILHFAEQKSMLVRDKNYLHQFIGDYAVAISDGKFAGVCGLRLWRPNRLEIISLAVKPKLHNLGIGSALIQERINHGVALGYDYFFTLTKSPKIFEKLGFDKTNFKKLTLKIQSDCRSCPKNDAGPGKGSCNEIPLKLKIQP